MNQAEIRTTRLYQMVSELKVPFGLERSFRIGPNKVLTNRFLIMLAKSSFGLNADETVLRLCHRLGMSESLLRQSSKIVNAAEFVHLGYEEGESTSIYKVYFEVGLPADADTDPNRIAPILQHVAFKWSISDPDKNARAHYYAPRDLSDKQIVAAATGCLENADVTLSREIEGLLNDVLSLSKETENFLYLQVAEDNNPRHSFAVTLYQAGVPMSAVRANVQRICRHFEAHFDTLEETWNPNATFGNLAGGIHRSGQPFVTFYHGASSGIDLLLTK